MYGSISLEYGEGRHMSKLLSKICDTIGQKVSNGNRLSQFLYMYAYGSKCWGVVKADMSKLDEFQRLSLQDLQHLLAKMFSNEILFKKTG